MTTVIIVLVLLFLMAAWFLVPFAIRKVNEVRLAKVCRERRIVVLTYDDGPGQTLTNRLLDLLDAEKCKVTFFALGRNLGARREVARRIVEAGHDLGSHTYNHSNAWKTAPWTAVADAKRGAETVENSGGHGSWFRPPFGKMTLSGLFHGAKAGYRYGWWTIDTRDSWQRRPVDDVLHEIEEQGGGVVLMHDFDHYDKAPASPSHADHVIALTQRIIALAKARGMTILPLSALEKWPSGVQS